MSCSPQHLDVNFVFQLDTVCLARNMDLAYLVPGTNELKLLLKAAITYKRRHRAFLLGGLHTRNSHLLRQNVVVGRGMLTMQRSCVDHSPLLSGSKRAES